MCCFVLFSFFYSPHYYIIPINSFVYLSPVGQIFSLKLLSVAPLDTSSVVLFYTTEDVTCYENVRTAISKHLIMPSNMP